MAAPCFTKAQGQVLLHKLPIQLTECKCSTGSWHKRQLFWQVSALIHQAVKVLTVGSRWTLSAPTTPQWWSCIIRLHTHTHTYTDVHTNTLNTHPHTQEKHSPRGCTNWPGLRLGFSSTTDVFSSAWEDHSLTSRAVVRATTKERDLDLRSAVVTESALWAQNTNLPLDKALWLQPLD